MNFDSMDSLNFFAPPMEDVSVEEPVLSLHQEPLPAVSGPTPSKPSKEEQPKRPNSAFNIFFQVERQRLISEDTVEGPYTRAEVYSISLDKATRVEKSKRPHRKTHGRITFVELAKTIAQKWKNLDTPNRRLFEERASDEKRKYAIELEDYLLKQAPTQQVKKRLSALRRGSLSKYIKERQSGVSSPISFQQTPSSTVSSTFSPSDHRAIHSVSPSSTVPSLSRRGSTASVVGQVASPEVAPERQVQFERARNLQRLYQMQLQLYDQQMRLQAECRPPPRSLHPQASLYEDPSIQGAYHSSDGFGPDLHVVSRTFETDEPAFSLPYDEPVNAFDDHEPDAEEDEGEYLHHPDDPLL